MRNKYILNYHEHNELGCLYSYTCEINVSDRVVRCGFFIIETEKEIKTKKEIKTEKKFYTKQIHWTLDNAETQVTHKITHPYYGDSIDDVLSAVDCIIDLHIIREIKMILDV